MLNPNLTLSIKGVKGEIRKDFLIIKSEVPLKTMSSAVLNGGLRDANAIINCQVPKDYDHIDPQGYLKSITRKAGLSPEQVVGLMTAVNVSNVAVVTQQYHGLTVSAIVTAGLSNAAKAGDPALPVLKTGTINIIIVIDGNLTEGCMVDAVKTVTEAKSMALRELDIRSLISSELASGTTTDAIVVACTNRGKPIDHAGTATKLGEMIGISTIKAVKEAIRKQEGITSDRSLTQRLRERGITLEDLLSTALELFQPHPGVETNEKASKMLKEGFEQALSDVNVAALVVAGLKLEEEGRCGLIPSLSEESFKRDPIFLVADEILGMAIANYIAGTRGMFEFVRFDRIKPGVLKRLGPVLDDVIGGIVAGVSSNIYTTALTRKSRTPPFRTGSPWVIQDEALQFKVGSPSRQPS